MVWKSNSNDLIRKGCVLIRRLTVSVRVRRTVEELTVLV